MKRKQLIENARRVQNNWLIKALMHEAQVNNYILNDEELHIAQQYAHALEIQDAEHAKEIVKRSIKEWQVLKEMIDEEYDETTI